MKKFYIIAELLALFVALPLLFFLKILPSSLILVFLFVSFLYVCFILKSHEKSIFINDFKSFMLAPLLVRFTIVCALMFAFTYFYKPNNLFYFVRSHPYLWLGVMLFYPLFSAFTQEVIYRKFFFFRYTNIFGEKLTFVLSALLFSYMHMVFHNAIAVVFTFFGGFIFAYVYKKTKSLMLVSIEHALYGDALFTFGLGYYFYHGSV